MTTIPCLTTHEAFRTLSDKFWSVIDLIGYWFAHVKRRRKEKSYASSHLPSRCALKTTESCRPEYWMNSYFQRPKQRRFSSTGISLLLLFPGCTLVRGKIFSLLSGCTLSWLSAYKQNSYRLCLWSKLVALNSHLTIFGSGFSGRPATVQISFQSSL